VAFHIPLLIFVNEPERLLLSSRRAIKSDKSLQLPDALGDRPYNRKEKAGNLDAT
jgi:hypothetical protein